jgi:predicted ATPase
VTGEIPLKLTKGNFYIITGGPGAGKTKLLDNLELLGYNYIRDTARQIIKERISKGLSPRPDPMDFAQEMFDRDWANYITNAEQSSLLFFDRSFMDSACLLYDFHLAGYEKIRDTHLKNRYNNRVFIAPPWREIYRTDSERDQTFQESVAVYERIDKWYREHGYEVVILPKDSVENRTKFIVDQITHTK